MSDSLQVTDLVAGYSKTPVLDGISFSIQPGEFVALLGPSGCGKTTLLQVLAGFLKPASGSLVTNTTDITNLPPEHRNMAMVFQSYALWPHMTVFQNIAYALKLRKKPQAEIEQKVSEVLELVNLTGYEHRPVTGLSGGQRQRVALARALAVEPSILLLDEPLSNLDARVRASVRHEIKSLQKKLGFTAIMVTHDQEEAMSMADKVIILNQGKIEQAGSPESLYCSPASAFVADFMGAENRLSGTVYHEQDKDWLKLDHCDAPLPVPYTSASSYEGRVDVYFRSNEVSLAPETNEADQGFPAEAIVLQRSYMGQGYRHSIKLGDATCIVDHDKALDEQSLVQINLPPEALHIYPASENSAIAG
ncbi:ABC transporter ATP-binding protein [Endozoicomonadaceae bacterium StTr2]